MASLDAQILEYMDMKIEFLDLKKEKIYIYFS